MYDVKAINDCFEIHYYLDNGSHEMNAFSENNCTYQILESTKTFSKQLGFYIDVVTFPTSEGGLIKWLKIVKKQEDKTAPITTELVKYLVMGAFSAVFFFGNKILDYVTRDTSLEELQKAALVKYLEENDCDVQPMENKISKLRSNFYSSLETSDNVNKVEFTSFDKDGKIVASAGVQRSSFSAYVLTDNKLDPEDIDDVTILITSPVISKGNYNTWHGRYKDEYIGFKMCSNEFKTLIQSGDVVFKNGFTINCALRIHRCLTETGEAKITKYEVIRVNKYFIDDKAIETIEGKKHRQQVAIDNSPNLFSGFEDI